MCFTRDKTIKPSNWYILIQLQYCPLAENNRSTHIMKHDRTPDNSQNCRRGGRVVFTAGQFNFRHLAGRVDTYWLYIIAQFKKKKKGSSLLKRLPNTHGAVGHSIRSGRSLSNSLIYFKNNGPFTNKPCRNKISSWTSVIPKRLNDSLSLRMRFGFSCRNEIVLRANCLV